MKIVDVAEFFAEQGGGVRTYIHQKLEAGSKAGHEIVIVAPGPSDGEEERLGGRIVWVKGPPLPPDPRYYILWRERAVHEILDREAPDVVEGSSPWTGGWFAARWPGKAIKTFIFHADPVAVYPQTFLGRALGTDRVDRLFGWYWAYLRRLSARFDATIVSGYWLADKLTRFGLTNPVTVPFGVDKHFFSPELRSAEMRRRLLASCGIKTESAQLLIAANRFHPEKRLGTLIRAFDRVRRERPAGLVMFGDGPLRTLIRRYAAKVPGVHLAGYTRDRHELAVALASADALIHGSAAETYGIIVAEAICSGLPIVVPNVGGAVDLAGDGYAELYPPGDAKAAATAILRLLERPRAELVAGVARAAAEKVGTMEDHFEQLFELYEGMLVPAPSPRGEG